MMTPRWTNNRVVRGTTNSKSIVFFCTPNEIFCTAVLKNSDVRKIFCLYDSYVDLPSPPVSPASCRDGR